MTARAAALALLALAASAAHAGGQAVEAEDGSVVRVSAAEPNLVEAREGRVSAFVFTEGSMTETIDGEAGVVYFRPLGEGPTSGFVEVTDEGGMRTRFSLIVVPDPDRPAQRILLGAAPVRPEAGPEARPALPSGHVAGIKEVVRDLAAGGHPPAAAGGGRTLLGSLAVTRFVAVRRGGLVGELLQIENNGEAEVEVEEAMLRLDPGVVAVSLGETSVAPGQRAEAYIVRRAEGGR